MHNNHVSLYTVDIILYNIYYCVHTNEYDQTNNLKKKLFCKIQCYNIIILC